MGRGRKRIYESKEEEMAAKKVRDANRYRRLLNLGPQYDRWCQLAQDLEVDNLGLVGLLLDRYVYF